MFGKNAVHGPRTVAEGYMVNSLFYTIQGEGPWAGKPTIFLRLSRCNLRCHFCVPGNTKIVMASGLVKNITDIRRGDMVLSYANRKYAPGRVRSVHPVRSADSLIHIVYGDNFLYATPEHPIYTRNRGFVPAGELTTADKLKAYKYTDHLENCDAAYKNYVTMNHFGHEDITSVRVANAKKLDELSWGRGMPPVYNFSVEGTETYIANGIVVHNCDTEFETGVDYSLDGITRLLTNAVEAYGCKDIVITGGEPMLHDLTRLVMHRDMLKLNFQIETAGTVWPLGFGDALMHKHVTIVCSPKTPKVHPMIAKHTNAWKYILNLGDTSPVDGLPIKSTQTEGVSATIYRPFSDSRAQVYVQACDMGDDVLNKANLEHAAAVAMKHKYRLSVQLHKIIGID